MIKGLALLLTVLLITLKVCHVIAWSWLWVFAPYGVYVLLVIMIIILQVLLDMP